MAVKTVDQQAGPRIKIRDTGLDLVFIIILYLLLSLILAILLYPLIFVLSASVSDPSAIMAGKVVLFPVGFTLKAYQAVLDYDLIWVGFSNSLFYTVVGTLVNLVVTILAGYALSRKDLVGKNFFMFLFAFTMLFNGGIVPTYLVVNDLGLINSRWALIIPQALSIWNLIITVTYFRTSIPVELLEAAQLDGCSDFQYLARVVLPLSAPIVAVLTLFYAVGHWNEYFSALLYLNEQGLYPLQIMLRNILVQNQIDFTMIDISSYAARQAMRELLKYALIVVASVPVLLIYPFVQRYFIKGIMIGAIKG
jgi:multiple sugar transport system permease protein/putative aldouronate transport system permease protein